MEFNAFVDTGADGTLFDIALAEGLGLDLASGRTIRISGVGGEIREAKEVEIVVELLRRSERRATIQATFAPDVASTYGNLLGINVWSLFDVGLVHSRRSVGLSLTKPSS